MNQEMPFRIMVVHPPAGVTFRLQRGRTDLDPPARASEERIVFEFSLRVQGERTGGAPRLLGACAQGPPDDRFVYINSGTMAGQADSCWTRRAKVLLSGVSWELIDQVLANPDTVLEARIEGTGRDGGPVCARVPLLESGWKVSPKEHLP
jgi:hypothetical protein